MHAEMGRESFVKEMTLCWYFSSIHKEKIEDGVEKVTYVGHKL